MEQTKQQQQQGLVIYCSLDRLVILRNALNNLVNMGVPVGNTGHLKWGDVNFLFLNDRKQDVDTWAFAKMAAQEMQTAAYAGEEPPKDEPKDPEGG